MSVYDMNKKNEVRELFGNYLQEELIGTNPANKDDFSEESFEKLGKLKEIKSEIDLVPLRKPIEVHDSQGRLIKIYEDDVYKNGKYQKTVMIHEYKNGKTYVTKIKKIESKTWGNLLVQKGKTIELKNIEDILAA